MAVNDWFRSTLLSRLDDKQRSVLIMVMQRLHVNDLTGFAEGERWVSQAVLPGDRDAGRGDRAAQWPGLPTPARARRCSRSERIVEVLEQHARRDRGVQLRVAVPAVPADARRQAVQAASSSSASRPCPSGGARGAVLHQHRQCTCRRRATADFTAITSPTAQEREVLRDRCGDGGDGSTKSSRRKSCGRSKRMRGRTARSRLSSSSLGVATRWPNTCVR